MLASATLTTVLSRKVKNSSVHSEARARGRRRELTMAAAAGARASATRLTAADGGQLGSRIRNRQLGQPAETRSTYLPDAAEVDRRAHLILEQRRAEQQDLVVHRGPRRRGNRHRTDGRGGPSRCRSK